MTAIVNEQILAGVANALKQTAAELAQGVSITKPYLPGDVRRYGIIPNSAGAATVNTVALKALLNPLIVTGFTGKVFFPNVTGGDIYYFNDLIGVRDGCHLDLCGSTLHFAKAAVTGDVNTGFLTAIRDVTIENGSIVVDYDDGGVGNRGNAIFLGYRDISSIYTTPLFDSALSRPMGNICLRNLYINQNSGRSTAILMLGGLQNVIIENIVIEGNGTLGDGIYYEFGWATNEALRENRQTSHGQNFHLRNIEIRNLNQVTAQYGIGVGFGGAYNVLLENIKVYTSQTPFSFTCGEALFFRPWSNQDGAGSKHNVVMRNCVAANMTGTAVSVAGGQLNTGYLSALGTLANNYLTDLMDLVIEDCAFRSVAAGGYGIQSSAGRLTVKRTYISGFQRGIVTTTDTTHFLFEDNNIYDCTQWGMQIGLQFGVGYSPFRLAVGIIRGNFIHGNGTSGAGVYDGINLASIQSCVVESNRFGNEMAHDSVDEAYQGAAVKLSDSTTTVMNVVLRNNYVAGTVEASGYAYYAAHTSPTSPPNGNTMESGSGITVQRGAWKNLLTAYSGDRGDSSRTLVPGTDFVNQLWGTTLTGNRVATLSITGAAHGDRFHIKRTGLGTFTLDVGGLKTIPSATAGWVDVIYDGIAAAWILDRYGLL